ncbi:type IV pilus secretin PilQ [Acinetobacter sp. HY1485]|uniref:type IV pilus secretin PilQ n=1 Tax=Acinetobacter sp. HY1485 TaxID=2970918 RepID=UPI0022B99AED|nr:AMIN domain-containing protein [Acinetobacter sp. HY1485]
MKNAVKRSFIGDNRNMKPFVHQFSLGVIAVAMAQVAQAGMTVTNIVPMQVAGQGTEIRVMFNGLPPQPQAYQLDKPSRLILDFDKAGQSLQKTSIPVGTSEASSVDISSDLQRSRLTVNLNKAGDFTTRVEGNTFILKINSPAQTAKAVAKAQVQGAADVRFNRGSKKDEGQVVVDLLSPNTPVDVQQRGSKVVIRLLGNKLPTSLVRRLNVTDFATPVSVVDAYNDGSNGVIEVQNTGNFDYMAFQAEKRLTVSVTKKAEPKQFDARSLQTNYKGKKISLDFQDIEVRRVLQLLADFTGTNIVAADTVQGNITLRLKDVPWDQALDLILKTKNLDKRGSGDVIWIAPSAEIAKYEEDQAKAYQQSIKLAPLQTEYIQLNYARAKDVLNLVKNNEDKKNTENSFLSERGRIVTDDRTNTVVISDTADKVNQMKNLLSQLDVPVQQVMVEARIVRTSKTFSHEIGVNWSFSKTSSTSTGVNNFGIDLGTTTSYGSMSLGLLRVGSNLLDLKLAASQSDGESEVLSTPKIMTGDKQEAVIRSGVQLPYQTTSANSGTTTTFQDAVLELKVVPSITPDGKVQMKLNLSKDTQGELTDAGYAINTNKLNTNVLVSDGETVVLGGLYEDTTSKTIKKVPVLGDIPYVGGLFKNTLRENTKGELLMFITPRIVNDSSSRNH